MEILEILEAGKEVIISLVTYVAGFFTRYLLDKIKK